MKTEGFVDRSLDDFIKANRGMFRRGRGRGSAAGRGAASARGGRGGGRGAARGRSSSRGSTRGSGRGRGSSRGVARGSSRGRSASRGRVGGRGGTSRGSRGQRGAARGTRGTRGTFGQRWRASSARMGNHLESAAPAASTSPLKRKQLTVKTVRGSKLAGRLGTPGKGVKRLTTLALKKKRQALQQLTNGKQLSRTDARNQILMKRRGLTEEEAVASPARRGRGASRAAARAAAAASRRPPPQGRVQVIHESAASAAGRQRQPLNRSRVTGGSVTAPSGASLLTVQFKNDMAVRQRRPPPPMEMDLDDDLPLPLPLPPSPPPPPPPPPRNRAGLDPRIQQEIAAIQARGRSQHHLSEDAHTSGVSNFRPTAATSSRTLNDRFTADRVIFS